jgi:uncharacterized protein
MFARRLISLCAAALFLLLTAGPHAGAQESDALRFFQQNPGRLFFRSEPPARPAPPPRRVQPRREREPVYVAPRRRVVPEPESDVAIVVQPDRPIVPVTTFVYVAGDSLGELLAQGLKEQLAESRPEIGVVKRARSSSGLVRDDFYDWGKALKELAAGSEKVDLVVMMLGSNDRQSLKDETGAHEFKSDRWREIYARRVDEMIAAMRDKQIPFVIVGMPAMQSQRLSADMLVINEVLRERATRAGATFVDIWEGFVSDQGQFASSGPDVNGQIVKLRTADGIHFTRAGARKLGFFAGKDIDQLLKGDRRDTEIAALPSDLSEQIKRDAPGLVPQSLQTVITLPLELPALPVIHERPLAGPTTELTGPPLATGGRIANGKALQPASELTILVEQALGYGRLPPAKPGRADDFAWPRRTMN